MPLSDKEVRNVLGFYTWLRKVVFIAGVVVMVAAVVAGIALVYNIGRKDGSETPAVAPASAPAASSEQTETAPTPEPRLARARIEAPPDPEPAADNAEQTEAGKAETDSGGKQAPQTGAGENCCRIAGADTTAPQPDTTSASTAPASAMSEKQIFVDASAALPADGEPEFSVTVRPKKRGWARRFFGAIGRGVGKALGVR